MLGYFILLEISILVLVMHQRISKLAGSLKGDGAEAGLSAGTGGSNLATRVSSRSFRLKIPSLRRTYFSTFIYCWFHSTSLFFSPPHFLCSSNLRTSTRPNKALFQKPNSLNHHQTQMHADRIEILDLIEAVAVELVVVVDLITNLKLFSVEW
jgi:hypothetical protein